MIPMLRDRNSLSIQFRENVSEEVAHALLAQYDLEIRGQVHPVPLYLVRCRNHPAEFYYTTYGDTLETRLGNRSEVQFALPVFFNEFNATMMLTDRLILRFNDDLPEETQALLLDSLKQADILTELPFELSVSRHLLQLSKASPQTALELANRYDLQPWVRSATEDWAFRLVGSLHGPVQAQLSAEALIR